MKMRFALVALPFLLTACGPQAGLNFPWAKQPEAAPAVPAPVPPKPGIPEPTGASPLAQPLEIAGAQTPRATANAATHKVEHIGAKGADWQVVVHGGGATFTGSNGKSTVVGVKRISYAGGLEYAGVMNGKPFVLHLTPVACEGMPMTANLRANGNRLTGCATEIAPAPAPVIPKAPVKKTPRKPAAAKPAAPATPAPTPTPTPTPTPEAPKVDAPKVDAPKPEAPKPEAPKTEAPKTEAPKSETPATEAPKTEAPKTETPATPALPVAPASNG